MNWKQTARKDVIGDKVVLKSIKPEEKTLKAWEEVDRNWKEYFIKPKRYSISGKDKVDAITMSNTKSLPGKVMTSMVKITKENPGIKDKDLFSYLSEEEQALVIDSQLEKFENTEMIKTIIIQGLSETNLIEGQETLEDFADEVLEFQAIATEIVEIIRAYNLPLESKKSKG